MITDNRGFKKSSAVTSLLLLVIILLCSCSPDTNSYEYLFEGGRDELEELPIETDTFIIVLPANASGKIYDATVSLAQKIEEKTLSKTSIIYDYEKLQPKSRDMLILIGRTDYNESQNFLRDFRKDDFGYTYSERTVLICGICEHSILSAIEKFREDVVLYADSELFISEGTEYIFRADYNIKRITLNGYQLCDYSLVYPNGNTDAFALASYFQGIVAENTGYYLDIKSDSQISKDARAICIGKTKLDTTVSENIGKGESRISEYPSGISLISYNSYTAKLALDSFLDTLCATDASAVADVKVSSSQRTVIFDEVKITDVSPSALSFNILTNTATAIRDNSPSCIRISDTFRTDANSLLFLLESNYAILSLGESTGKQTHYIYDASKYNASYQKCENITEGDIYIVSFSDLSSKVSFTVFDIELTTNTEIAASAVTEKISSVIETSGLLHGAVFFDSLEPLITSLANTLPSANKLSDGAYSFGGGTFLDAVKAENGITNIFLTFYR